MQSGDEGHEAGSASRKPSRSGMSAAGVGTAAHAIRKSLDVARRSGEFVRKSLDTDGGREANTARRISVEVSRLSNEIAR
jgi:hypothetical protein